MQVGFVNSTQIEVNGLKIYIDFNLGEVPDLNLREIILSALFEYISDRRGVFR